MNNKKVGFKEVWRALKQIPKTITIIRKVDKKGFTLIVMLSMIAGAFPVITLVLSQELINSIVKKSSPLRYTIILFTIYIIVSFLGSILGEAKDYIESKFQYVLQYKLNYLIMDKCTKLTLKDFETPAMYDKIEKITGEVAYKPYQIMIAIIGIITSVVTMLSSAFLLFAWNPYISMLLLVVPIISMLYYLKIGQQEFEIMWNRAKDERKTWYLTYLLTHDFSFKEISLLDLKDYFLKKYWSISALFIRQNTSILKRKTLFNILYELSIQIVSAIIIGVAIMSAYVGEILVGNVMSYIRSVGLVQTNSQAIMSNIYTVYSSKLYMDMLFQFLNYCVKEDSSEKIVMKEPINKIDIKELSFSYNGKTKVLDKINLTLVQGEKVALVGPNGSGKSTFLKILAGLYNIEEGEILINGRSLIDLDIRSYRSKMSVLFQDFVKYELSLRENIGFGDIQNLNNDEKMVQMLHKLQTKFLQTDNGSYNLDLQLGNWFEDGCQLSQGQWQKIALGRVYFRDASFYILDEPNAALDTVSEREVFEKFFELSKDKIGVFISHRLNAAKMADKIIVMDQGKIVGIGKHDELLRNCMTYQKLYKAESYEREDM